MMVGDSESGEDARRLGTVAGPHLTGHHSQHQHDTPLLRHGQ